MRPGRSGGRRAPDPIRAPAVADVSTAFVDAIEAAFPDPASAADIHAGGPGVGNGVLANDASPAVRWQDHCMPWPLVLATAYLVAALTLVVRQLLAADYRLPGERAGMVPPPAPGVATRADTWAADGDGDEIGAGPPVRRALPEPHRRVVIASSAGGAALGAFSVVARWGDSAAGFTLAVVAVVPLWAALTAIDIDVHRLPNRLTATLAAAVAAAMAGAALVDGVDGLQVRRAVVGALALGAFYLVLALLGGGQGMGLGDVKLAPSLGALMAWPGWQTWVTGAFAAFLIGGAWGVALILLGRGRQARMPFGPFMIAGALLGLSVPG